MCLTVAKDDAGRAVELLSQNGGDAYILGEIAKGDGGIELC